MILYYIEFLIPLILSNQQHPELILFSDLQPRPCYFNTFTNNLYSYTLKKIIINLLRIKENKNILNRKNEVMCQG